MKLQLLIIIILLSSLAWAQAPRQSVTLKTEFADGIDGEIKLEPNKKLGQFSPERLNGNRKLKEQLKKLRKNLIEGAGSFYKADFSRSFQNTRNFVTREFPAEVIAFYTAQFAVHLRQLVARADWEADDPGRLKGFVDYLFTPSGYVGFAGFVAASRISSLPIVKLAQIVESRKINAQAAGRYGIRTKLLGATSKSLQKLIIPSVSLGAGLAVSSIIEELFHDQDIVSCTELTQQENLNSRDENERRRACQVAYDRWTASHKLWEWTPHFVSLILSAQLSQTLLNSVKAGVNGARFVTRTNASGLTRKVFVSTLRKISVFFSKHASVLRTTPMGIGLGFGIEKIIQLYLFMETAYVIDHFLIRPWQIHRKSYAIIEYADKIDERFFELLGKEPNEMRPSPSECDRASYSELFVNFFTEDCKFDQRDFVSLAKGFSSRLHDFRGYLLQTFTTAASSWSNYTSEFVTISNGADQIYNFMGALVVDEQRLMREGKGEYGKTLLTSADFHYSLQLEATREKPHQFYQSSLKAIEKLLIEESGYFRKADRNRNHRQVLRERMKYEFSRGRYVHNRPWVELNSAILSFLTIHQGLLASHKQIPVESLEIYQFLIDRKIITHETDKEALREKLLTDGLRELRRTLGPDSKPSYAQHNHPYYVFSRVPRQLFDDFARPVAQPKPDDIFYKIFVALERPWPLEYSEHFLSQVIGYTDLGMERESSHFPKNWGDVKTPSLAEFMIAGLTCGPEPSPRDLFQRRSSWSEWFFNWFQGSNDRFVRKYNQLISEGKFEEAYDLIDELKFDYDYSLTGNFFSEVFGFKKVFIPPRVTEYPRGFSGGVSGPAVANYTPCRFQGNRRGHQVQVRNFNKNEIYSGLIDVVRHQLSSDLNTNDKLENWWKRQIQPGIDSHLRSISRRYKSLVATHFDAPFYSDKFYRMKGKRLKKISRSEAERLKRKNPKEYFRTVVPIGVAESMKFEFEMYTKFLTLYLQTKLPSESQAEALEAAEDLRGEFERLVGEKQEHLALQDVFRPLLFLLALSTNTDSGDPVEFATEVRDNIPPDIENVSRLLRQLPQKEIGYFLGDRLFQIVMELNFYSQQSQMLDF